jgi:uncharacterized membrane protein YfbV (UPF0208 family)
MTEEKFFTPLKLGLFAVIIAYFLFTLHGMFTLSWIGEWEPMREPTRTIIFVEDITATTCLAFRFLASIIAFGVMLTYLIKKNLSKPTIYKAVRLVLIFEGIYWLGLATTAGYSVQFFTRLISTNASLVNLTYSLLLSVIPTVLEAIILPIILFIFAVKLSPNKPLKIQIKWGLITGTLYIVVFWLINTVEWISVIRERGKDIQYLWMTTTPVNGVNQIVYHPEHLVSFIITVFGLAALAIYTTYFTKKSTGIENFGELKAGTIGAIILSLGMFFLWNYFSWVFFAGNTWNSWYAWFLGHNMDLWMLSLPLLGLPLLFNKKHKEENKSA